MSRGLVALSGRVRVLDKERRYYYYTLSYSHQYHIQLYCPPIAQQTKVISDHIYLKHIQYIMARTRNTTTTTTARPGLMSRLRNRHNPNAKVAVSEHTNPITGAHTRTKKTTTHPAGLGHHGHGGRGPLASEPVGATHSRHTHARRAPATHHQRKPSIGDKVSGAMMKLKGTLTHRPGVKVSFALPLRLSTLANGLYSGCWYEAYARY